MFSFILFYLVCTLFDLASMRRVPSNIQENPSRVFFTYGKLRFSHATFGILFEKRQTFQATRVYDVEIIREQNFKINRTKGTANYLGMWDF